MNAFFESKPAQDFSKISASIDITVRQLDLSFPDEIPEFWFKNNPLLTMLLTALSSAFPDGERQFIYSVRNYQDKISDPILLKKSELLLVKKPITAKSTMRLMLSCLKRLSS